MFSKRKKVEEAREVEEARMRGCEEARAEGCSDVGMDGCSDVGMEGCSDVGMDGCSDVGMDGSLEELEDVREQEPEENEEAEVAEGSEETEERVTMKEALEQAYCEGAGIDAETLGKAKGLLKEIADYVGGDEFKPRMLKLALKMLNYEAQRAAAIPHLSGAKGVGTLRDSNIFTLARKAAR